MATTTRVTVTLPAEVVKEIDRLERNRSRFVLEGVRRELRRRRREALRQSLAAPHSESLEVSEEGLSHWADELPHDDSRLVDPGAGIAIRWVEGEGWQEADA
jgi:metal-responsive CopG/Arc/MetJ family transcriptional regulator